MATVTCVVPECYLKPYTALIYIYTYIHTYIYTYICVYIYILHECDVLYCVNLGRPSALASSCREWVNTFGSRCITNIYSMGSPRPQAQLKPTVGPATLML